MDKKIHYDNETIRKVRNIDMVEFLECYKIYSFKQQGNSFRCNEHNSLVVQSDKIRWFWNSKGVGGAGVIDYLMKIENASFAEAMEIGLKHINLGNVQISANRSNSSVNNKILSLPDKALHPPFRLIDYLTNKRGIDTNIVFELLEQHKIYEDKRSNIVFLGHDENGKPRFGSIRGTYDKQFRMDCTGSDKRYSFNMTYNAKGKLYVFESPIDAMSYATLINIEKCDVNAYTYGNYLSLGGVTDIALDKYLEIHKDIKEIVFCLDNDSAGREVSTRISRKYSKFGYFARIEIPENKDFNDDLLKALGKFRIKENKNDIIQCL